MLEGTEVTKRFGGLLVLSDIDFYVDNKEIVGLIGPNGAGKTTLFNVICGVYKPDKGSIKFEGRNIAGLKPHEICRIGIARTFQIVRPFSEMTVLENVMVGAIWGSGKSISKADAKKEALLWLEFVGLSDKKNIRAYELTHADKRMLELARALATNPKIILLDEVVAGLNPAEVSVMMDKIKKIWENGTAVFWIEHVMKAIMGVCHRIIVLHYGRKIAEGNPKTVSKNEAVIQAYLGGIGNA